jgi:hypothetical protein
MSYDKVNTPVFWFGLATVNLVVHGNPFNCIHAGEEHTCDATLIVACIKYVCQSSPGELKDARSFSPYQRVAGPGYASEGPSMALIASGARQRCPLTVTPKDDP